MKLILTTLAAIMFSTAAHAYSDNYWNKKISNSDWNTYEKWLTLKYGSKEKGGKWRQKKRNYINNHFKVDGKVYKKAGTGTPITLTESHNNPSASDYYLSLIHISEPTRPY